MAEDTVLVTGCSSGIGRVTAETFLDDGWTVYATARDRDDVAALGDQGCETLELDVTDPEECADAVDRVVEERGHLDCLVNNAGYAQYGPVEDVPPRRVHDQFAVNVYGPHRLIRHALPSMRDAGEGTIVNVSSAAGLVGSPGYGVYSASKFALEGLSDSLRPEVAPFGIDVVLVEPGPVDTGLQSRGLAELEALERTPGYEAIYRFFEDRSALGNLGTIPPEDVADAVLEAATCSNPEPRYPVGSTAKLTTLARHVPAKWRDFGYGLLRRLVS